MSNPTSPRRERLRTREPSGGGFTGEGPAERIRGHHRIEEIFLRSLTRSPPGWAALGFATSPDHRERLSARSIRQPPSIVTPKHIPQNSLHLKPLRSEQLFSCHAPHFVPTLRIGSFAACVTDVWKFDGFSLSRIDWLRVGAGAAVAPAGFKLVPSALMQRSQIESASARDLRLPMAVLGRIGSPQSRTLGVGLRLTAPRISNVLYRSVSDFRQPTGRAAVPVRQTRRKT